MPSCSSSSHSKRQSFTDHDDTGDQTVKNQLDGLSVDLPHPPSKSTLPVKDYEAKQPNNSGGSNVMKKSMKHLEKMQ